MFRLFEKKSQNLGFMSLTVDQPSVPPSKARSDTEPNTLDHAQKIVAKLRSQSQHDSSAPPPANATVSPTPNLEIRLTAKSLMARSLDMLSNAELRAGLDSDKNTETRIPVSKERKKRRRSRKTSRP